ncbi:FkbM family methyltransferase [Nostoc sp. NIES-2111]|nr:FkbM family methyltransferase [Nostoc sp. NIES-2111]
MFSYLYDRFFVKKPYIRRFVTRLIEGDKEKKIELLGCSIQVNSIKEHGYLRASRMARFSSLFRDELPIIIHLAALLSHADAFVDIGANVGIFSASLAKLKQIYRHINFYAFEANPDTFLRLQKTTYGLPIKAHCIALAEREGELEFVSGAVSHVFTTIENNYSDLAQKKVTVPCRRLDSFDILGNRIIIKIDVEGQELEVLKGAEDLFNSNRVIAVYLDGYKNNQVESWLKGYGFDFFDGRSLKKIEGEAFSLLAIKMEPNNTLIPQS